MKALKIVLMTVIFVQYGLQAQTIRKPWRELTSAERTTYVNAVNSLISDGTWQQYVSDHLSVNNGGFAYHGNDLFLPWHTYFLYYMEQEMGVPLVYWDWEYNQNGLTEWSAASPIFDNATGGNNGLFGRNLNASVANSLGRTLNFNSPPSGVVAGYLNQTNFTTFRQQLEGGLHGQGHCQIGGLMCNINLSPTDPTFYLHHSMVDKVYHEWVELYWTGSNLFSTTPIGTVTAEGNENPNDHIDSRTLKVWYADDHLLVLDDYTVSGAEVYEYTTGDVEATGFTVPNSTSCTFMADNGYKIVLKPGFIANNGSSFLATVSDIAGNGRIITQSSGDSWVNDPNEEMAEEKLETVIIYPNPSAGSFRINLPQSMMETFDYKRDYLGLNVQTDDFRGTISIYDLNGRLVVSKKVTGADIPYVDMSINQKGSFIVEVRPKSGSVYSEQIIIR